MCEEAQIIYSNHLCGGNLLSQSSIVLRLHYVAQHRIPCFFKFYIHLLGIIFKNRKTFVTLLVAVVHNLHQF